MLLNVNGQISIVCDECFEQTESFDERDYDLLMVEARNMGFSFKGRLIKGSPNCLWENLCLYCGGRDNAVRKALKFTAVEL